MKFIILALFVLLNLSGTAQVWQWSVEIDSMISNETNAPSHAFLWIPENCKQVRAVLVGQHNMLEEGIFEHSRFRKTLSDLGFAEVWVSPNLNITFDFHKDAIQVFNGMMKKLADSSGYSELAYAPIVPIGHSALASYPWNFGAGMPERTLAMLSIHGDAPLTNLTGSGRPNPDWGNRTLDGIPGLMVEGEYEWWVARIQPALDYRQQHPNAPISFFGDAGRGHFDYSDQLIDYLGLFLRKAAQYRLPAVLPINQVAQLRPVDPSKGWLEDRYRPDTLPSAPPAAYNEYKGDKKQAFWYFDREMALVTQRYYDAVRGKKDQYIGFIQHDTLLRFQPKQHARILPTFEPEADGVTFHLAAAFTDTLRQRKADEHAKGKITISRICGPVAKINDTTFAVRFYRMGFNSPKRSGDIWLLAENGGDAVYKSTVQQANVRIPILNKEGTAQQINFPVIADPKLPLQPIPLKATATGGMPVYYYVMEGPAEIKDNQLVFSKIPPRARYPVKVTVAAWQYGRSIAPKIQSAEPVFRTFYIYR